MSNDRDGMDPGVYQGVVPTINPPTIVAQRAPGNNDRRYKIGTIWLDKVANASYQLTSVVASVATWTALGAGAVGGVVTLTGDAGGAIAPVVGNIDVLGTTNEVVTTGTAGTITVSLPATVVAPGSIESTTSIESGTTITAGTGLIVTDGGLLVNLGGVLVLDGDIINTHSDAATDVTIEVTNSDNTSGASRAGVEIATGGSSSGDPYLSFQVSGVGASTMTMGLDNSAADLFVISNSTAIGTSNALTLTQAGALTATTSVTATLGAITATNGNVVLGTAGNKLVSSSVGSTTAAGANSFGKVTLVGGTATIATTAVTAASIIILTRHTVGATGAAALGMLSIGTVTAGVSFIINAWKTTNATDLATTDVSNISWMIIN